MNMHFHNDATSGANVVSDVSVSASNDGCEALSLEEFSQGQQARIARITGQPGFSQRLSDLGLRRGAVVDVVQKNASGIVLGVGGTRLALGPAAASHVLVCAMTPQT